MATTSYGTPYVQSSDLVSGWPNASLNVADRIDAVSYAGNGLNAQTGTTYTLVVGDAGKTITLNNAGAVAVTLPQDSVANLPTGAVVNFYNLGAGTVTISAGAGATFQGGPLTAAQYGYAAVIKLSANTYGLFQAVARQVASANVATSQNTTSTTYTDLATAGPAVTLTTGTEALVIISNTSYNATANYSLMTFAISGASTVAASDTNAIRMYGAGDTSICRTIKITGLTAGSNTFTAKYRAGASTAVFYNRDITVMGL